MTNFEIQFRIIANDPSEIMFRPDTGKDIKLISIGKNKRHAILAVTIKSDDLHNAIEIAEMKINDFLDFQSLFFSEDMEIEGFFRLPIDIIDVDTNMPVPIPSIKIPAIVINPNEKIMAELHEYAALIHEKKNVYLKTALSFLRNARIRNAIPTNIVELFAVLEALFSKDEERTEMKYRISNRVATLMGKDEIERKNLLTQIRHLYDLRSTLVHGSIAKKPDYEDLFSITRRAVFRFLDLARVYDNHNGIIDKIDESILENSIRIKLQNESDKLLLSLGTINTDIVDSRLFPEP